MRSSSARPTPTSCACSRETDTRRPRPRTPSASGWPTPEAEPPLWVRAGTPEWISERLALRFGAAWLAEAQALAAVRAPVDLRVNALRGDVEAALRLLAVDGIEPERTSLCACGLRLPPAYSRDVQASRAWATGWVEVQDEASQIAVALADPAPGAVVVDYGAGGGGKTLALAAAMQGRGRLLALDTDAKRLAALDPRLTRSGARADVRRIGADGEGAEDLDAAADLVFVDAPCSGSGTWRRHPEAAWRLTPEALERLSALQRRILDAAARLVRPGGRLVYATCSVFAEENEAVADSFLEHSPEFAPLAVASAASTATGLTSEGSHACGRLGEGRPRAADDTPPHRDGRLLRRAF